MILDGKVMRNTKLPNGVFSVSSGNRLTLYLLDYQTPFHLEAEEKLLADSERQFWDRLIVFE
jgi:hypothetical protein